jgi:phage terminase large subunit-like protein
LFDQTSSSCTEVSEEQVHAAVSRVLCVTWKEQNESAIFLPETASAVNNLMQEGNVTVDIQVKYTDD